GVTTKLHSVDGVVERYLIIAGSALVTIGDREPERVAPGDVVVIPPGISQKAMNDGQVDLIFYCVCTPRFSQKAYKEWAR
ncbi:MAG TPA: cupin domain-containing protein, partial [Terriglobales bacterium]|nr:cupin domain-containing protein [Terriglobales bacterium]